MSWISVDSRASVKGPVVRFIFLIAIHCQQTLLKLLQASVNPLLSQCVDIGCAIYLLTFPNNSANFPATTLAYDTALRR